jgi:redox-sensitive bicupin YhaK (pirin superfamily)
MADAPMPFPRTVGVRIAAAGVAFRTRYDCRIMSSIAATLKPHTKDLGGFTVRRVLPGHPVRMVGPFVFFDHMGPAQFAAGHGVDVRPHPHIGLATVTYLFAGGIMHRDSLGCVQKILPGDVNWMVAGRGIVHSERTDPHDRETGHPLHGIQTWLALPKAHELAEPEFHHHPKESLPEITMPGVAMRLIAGRSYGETAPARTFSDMFYLAVEIEAGSTFVLPPEHAERAVYVVEGEIMVAGRLVEPQHMAVLAPGEAVEIASGTSSRVMLCGGEPMDGERHMFWNFVASDRAMIEDAKARWKSGGFDPVPGETEFIPLPE